jgi:hypothetical protein
MDQLTGTETVTILERATKNLGTAVWMSCFVVIGFGGLVLLSAIAYALVTVNYTLAAVCTFLLFAPLLMTVIWTILAFLNVMSGKWARSSNVSQQGWSDPVRALNRS